MDKSPLVDDVLLLMIAEAQPEGGKTKSSTNIQHILPFNYGMDTLKPSFSEILQGANRTFIESTYDKIFL